MSNSTHNSSKAAYGGYALPTVVALSVVIVIIFTSLLAVASYYYRIVPQEHSQTLAEEAAEAGVAYATSCLELSGRVQTWGGAASKPNLSPSADCNGTESFASNKYVYSDTRVRTYFVVGDLEVNLPHSVQISSRGYTEVLKPNGTVDKTYQSVVKKTITWATDYIGQMNASGTYRTCAIMSKSVYCWGYGAYGQLGNGMLLPDRIGSAVDIESEHPGYDSYTPSKVLREPNGLGNKPVKKIFVAQHHSCALTEEGKMYCWGINNNGQLGDGTRITQAKPVQVGGILANKVITDIGGTGNSSCAIAESQIYCWGMNGDGQVGDGTTLDRTTPVLVDTPGVATALSASGSRSRVMCAIISGKAYCWGQNAVGSVGDGTTITRRTPTKVMDTGVLAGKTVTSISQDGSFTDQSGYAHVCAVADSKVYCWGENGEGQVGDGTTTSRSTPVAVSGGALSGRNVQDVKLGVRHSCALSDGAVYCWGFNGHGQLGDTTKLRRTLPVTVYQSPTKLNGSNVIGIGAGANRGCAIIQNGRTFCWGLNDSGQIGDGTTTNRTVPTESLFLRPFANSYIF